MRRKPLDHLGVPPSVRWNAEFYLTLCCAERGRNVLCNGQIGHAVLQSACFYEQLNRWWVGVLVLMPDHLHGIFGFPYEHDMISAVRRWKRYLARTHALTFQRGFFDHRIRSAESYHEKAHYILQNPVRAGLVQSWEDWPYVFRRASDEGAQGSG
ncbi:MAG TPA: hypothetical protein VGD78_23505 [Chthoniobacterales bacterium]